MIIDASMLAEMLAADKDSVNEESFAELWFFLYNYLKKVMFLPGQSDMWLNVVNLGNLGMTALPRKPILAFADVCQNNMMYFMSKSYYLNVSWAQNTIWKGVKSFINEETRAKICLTSDNTHNDLKALVHPC